MSLDDLVDLLDNTPAVADMHPVSIYYLPEDVTVLESEAEARWLFDDPKPTLPRRLLITASNPEFNSRFPYAYLEHDPFTPSLNSVLFDRFDEIASRMLSQSQVAERIAAEAGAYDLIILLLVDGLSYQDVESWPGSFPMPLELDPCLVDVPTLTRTSFPNLIGDPPLAMRLFDLGYSNRLGFTYWLREDNQLTDRLFQTFAEVKRIGHFPQILSMVREYLGAISHSKSYIQIVRTGLDGYAHGQKRRPPVTAIVEEILREFEKTVELCSEVCDKLGLNACLYLTADHGILWRDQFEPEIVGNAPRGSTRWCSWRDLYHQSETGRKFMLNGEEYYCLGYPKTRRALRIDEQGIHGGISFQESIVPLVRVRIGE